MKVTHVAIRPSEESERTGGPSLTPELLAACGARYSRNNEGLEAILSKIDVQKPDSSVDSIFRFVDYGHQSIADMVPVAMFIDGISIWLAYQIWSLCPTAGGQESSTRYIRIRGSQLAAPEDLGIPDRLQGEWKDTMNRCFDAYERSLEIWDQTARQFPDATRLPSGVLKDNSEKGEKRVARMLRNFSFDRSRYFLPAAALTNLMLVMSARGWVQLCQHLSSHPLLECQKLGLEIRTQLQKSAPRLCKHATAVDSIRKGLYEELSRQASTSAASSVHLDDPSTEPECAAAPLLDVLRPPAISDEEIAGALRFHDNRYAWVGSPLCRTSVRFGWQAVAFAEIRDLNRHRTGTKYSPLVPCGFYSAADQLPSDAVAARESLRSLRNLGKEVSSACRSLLRRVEPHFVYWILLGTQFPFEHTTTGEKFIYEAELRTGVGAHFRYAEHFRQVLKLWYNRYAATRGLILEGSAEPE